MTLRRRSPLRARTRLSRRTRLRQVSDRRRRRDADYPAARAEVYERAGGRCEAAASPGCTGRAEQIHHVRGRGGPDPHDVEWLLAVCGPCHRHIEEVDRAGAYAAGWLVTETLMRGAATYALEGADDE